MESAPAVAVVEFMLWGIKSEALAIIAATFLGPIAAVIVTRLRDAAVGKRDRRLTIFRMLMATRRQRSTSITSPHST